MISRLEGYEPRRRGFVRSDVPIRCRYGHKIEGESIVHEGSITLTCQHQASRERPPCSESVFVIFGAPGRYFRADVLRDEALEMRRRGWSVDQILEYFGASWSDEVA